MGPLTWLYYRGWSANIGAMHAMERLWGPLTWLYYRGWSANIGAMHAMEGLCGPINMAVL